MKKYYNSLDRTLCIEILWGCTLGVNLKCILVMYWDGQKVVPRAGRYYGRPFQMGRGVTKWDLVPPTIFIIVVNAGVWLMLQEVYRPQEDLHGLGWAVGEQGIVLYADDGLKSGRNPIRVQGITTTLVRIFEWLGFYTNLGKTKSMKCTPRFIWGHLGRDAYKLQ